MTGALVTGAGRGVGNAIAPALDLSDSDWGRVLDVNLDAVAYLIESSCVTGVQIPVDGGVGLVG